MTLRGLGRPEKASDEGWKRSLGNRVAESEQTRMRNALDVALMLTRPDAENEQGWVRGMEDTEGGALGRKAVPGRPTSRRKGGREDSAKGKRSIPMAIETVCLGWVWKRAAGGFLQVGERYRARRGDDDATGGVKSGKWWACYHDDGVLFRARDLGIRRLAL
eukprot:1266786-Rhodomonas_salina.1